MKIGFRSHGVVSNLDIASRNGFEVIELMWEDYAMKNRDSIRKELESRNIGVSALMLGWERSSDEMNDDINYALSVGCKVIVVHPKNLTQDDKDGIEAFIDHYGPTVEYAEKKDTRVTAASCGLTPESWEIMFDVMKTPTFGGKYDPSHYISMGLDYIKILRRFGGRVYHTHAKDEICIDGKYDYAPCGMGDTHWGKIIATLYEMRYPGDIAIEPHSPFWAGEMKEAGLILAKRHLDQIRQVQIWIEIAKKVVTFSPPESQIQKGLHESECWL